jgi:choice-of-anchor B domain-containing protein
VSAPTPLRTAALVLGAAALSLAACDDALPEPDPLVFGTCQGGVALDADTTAYPCSGVSLAARLSPQQLGVTPAGTVFHNSVWGWADPSTGREYAVVGTADGTRFVDVTVPTAPLYLGRLPTAGTVVSNVWREVRVQGDLAVIVSEAPGHGLQVFDLKTLRGLAADPARLFTATARYTGFGSGHNVVVTEGAGGSPTVYGVGTRQPAAGLPAACTVPGFHAVDLSVPTAPTFAGCFNDAPVETGPRPSPGYTHDAQCMVYRGTDTDYTGREVCFASNEDVVTIFDVTDKADVRILSQAAYPNPAYTHQGALTQDGRFFLVDDELDELTGLATARTIVLDLRDLDDPDFAFSYTSALPVTDHNQYVRGGLAFQSNYEAGLRVLDVTGVAAGTLREVAFFDTYPQGQGKNTNGQWANYPYLPSGTVLANDISNGLFILTPDATLSR